MSTKLEQCFKRVHATGDMKKSFQFLPNSRLTNPVGFDIATVVQIASPYEENIAIVLYYGGVI